MADSIERCVRDMREAARVEGPTGMRDTLLTVAGRLEAVSAAAMAATVPSLDREALTDLIAEHLRGTYHCDRVWEAWRVGTMREGDFSPVEESDTPTELADEIITKLAPQAPVAGQPAEPSPLEEAARRYLAAVDDPTYSWGKTKTMEAASQATDDMRAILAPKGDSNG